MGKHEFVYRSTSSPEEIRSRIKAKSTKIKKMAWISGFYHTENGDMIKLYNGNFSAGIDARSSVEICLNITIKPDDSGAIIRVSLNGHSIDG